MSSLWHSATRTGTEGVHRRLESPCWPDASTIGGVAVREEVQLAGKRPRRKFSKEFKRDAVEIVGASGKPIR